MPSNAPAAGGLDGCERRCDFCPRGEVGLDGSELRLVRQTGAASLQYHGVSGVGGCVHGLEDDYKTFSKRVLVGDHDLWGQHLQNLIHHRLGPYALSLVDWRFHKVNGRDLARIHINPSTHPIYDHKGQTETGVAPLFWTFCDLLSTGWFGARFVVGG